MTDQNKDATVAADAYSKPVDPEISPIAEVIGYETLPVRGGMKVPRLKWHVDLYENLPADGMKLYEGAHLSNLITEQAALLKIAHSNIAWRELFWKVAVALNCLPSMFVDDNEHVLCRAKALNGGAVTRTYVDLTPAEIEAAAGLWVADDDDEYSSIRAIIAADRKKNEQTT